MTSIKNLEFLPHRTRNDLIKIPKFYGNQIFAFFVKAFQFFEFCENEAKHDKRNWFDREISGQKTSQITGNVGLKFCKLTFSVVKTKIQA